MSADYKIYALKEPDTDLVKYIGLTGRQLHERLADHLREKRNTPKNNWIKRLKRNGEIPEIELLEDGLSLNEAKKKECDYILLFKSAGANLKNLTLGGEGIFGFKWTDEAKKRQSERWDDAMRKRQSDLKKSVVVTDQTREKMSASAKNKIVSQTTRKKLSLLHAGDKNPFYGKKHTPEIKKQLADSRRGEKSVWFGKRHTEKTKLLISSSGKGKHDLHGCKNPNASLTNEDVMKIRSAYSPRKVTYAMLAKMFDVNPDTIYRAVKGISWKSVA